MKKFLSTFGTIILTAVVTSGASFFFQRNYLSKFEENNLIRELIPSLTSTEPAQVDMALLILEKSINQKDYLIIKGIVDKKVANIVANTYVPIEKNPSVMAPPQSKIGNRSKINEYAAQREDWKQIIKKKEQDLTASLSREDLLKLLDSIDGMTLDKVQKLINIEIAKKINNEDFFAAIIGLDWMLHSLNDSRSTSLKGILKNNLKTDQRQLLENYFNENGYDKILRILKFKNLVKFDLDDENVESSAGLELDKVNKAFLAIVKTDNAFHDLFSVSKDKKYNSKFENIK